MDKNDNIRHLCSHCGDEARRIWQEENRNTLIEIQDYVKIRFDQEDIPSEWMWVLVTDIMPDDMFVGQLDNDPINLTNIKCGDLLEFKREEIAMLVKKEDQ